MQGRNYGQETEHVKLGHVKIDLTHFRAYFRVHCQIPVSTGVGVFVGTPWCVLHRHPELSWAFPWSSSCTLPCAFS